MIDLTGIALLFLFEVLKIYKMRNFLSTNRHKISSINDNLVVTTV